MRKCHSQREKEKRKKEIEGAVLCFRTLNVVSSEDGTILEVIKVVELSHSPGTNCAALTAAPTK